MSANTLSEIREVELLGSRLNGELAVVVPHVVYRFAERSPT
jgi:hypothetical protein